MIAGLCLNIPMQKFEVLLCFLGLGCFELYSSRFLSMESYILFMSSQRVYTILRMIGTGLERNEPVANFRLSCE